MFQVMPALCPHEQRESGDVVSEVLTDLDRARKGPKNSQICADILYGWPLGRRGTLLFLRAQIYTFSRYTQLNPCLPLYYYEKVIVELEKKPKTNKEFNCVYGVCNLI